VACTGFARGGAHPSGVPFPAPAIPGRYRFRVVVDGDTATAGATTFVVERPPVTRTLPDPVIASPSLRTPPYTVGDRVVASFRCDQADRCDGRIAPCPAGVAPGTCGRDPAAVPVASGSLVPTVRPGRYAIRVDASRAGFRPSTNARAFVVAPQVEPPTTPLGPPTIANVGPYELDASVVLEATCPASDATCAATVQPCEGARCGAAASVAVGGPLPTGDAGSYRIRVTAARGDERTQATRDYAVLAPEPEPDVRIASPKDGGSYGSAPTASYTCVVADTGAIWPWGCIGTVGSTRVADGAALPEAGCGAGDVATLTVTATREDGTAAGRASATYAYCDLE
jgi:hypothetical protein